MLDYNHVRYCRASGKFHHTLDNDIDGTQKVLTGCFNLLLDAHHSWGFYDPRDNLRLVSIFYIVVATISDQKYFVENSTDDPVGLLGAYYSQNYASRELKRG